MQQQPPAGTQHLLGSLSRGPVGLHCLYNPFFQVHHMSVAAALQHCISQLVLFQGTWTCG
jgi:hypothetical protein